MFYLAAACKTYESSWLSVSTFVQKVVKQREMEMIDDMAFTLSRVSLGVNQRNKEVSSCVVLPTEVQSEVVEKILSAQESFMLDCIIMAVDSYGRMRKPEPNMSEMKCIDYDDFYKVLVNRGYKELYDKNGDVTVKNIKSATNSARIQLKKKGRIMFNKDYLWLV